MSHQISDDELVCILVTPKIQSMGSDNKFQPLLFVVKCFAQHFNNGFMTAGSRNVRHKLCDKSFISKQ